MNDEIRREQEKCAMHFKSMNADEKETQLYALMCWLQGFEAGYQAGVANGKTADC